MWKAVLNGRRVWSRLGGDVLRWCSKDRRGCASSMSMTGVMSSVSRSCNPKGMETLEPDLRDSGCNVDEPLT